MLLPLLCSCSLHLSFAAITAVEFLAIRTNQHVRIMGNLGMKRKTVFLLIGYPEWWGTGRRRGRTAGRGHGRGGKSGASGRGGTGRGSTAFANSIQATGSNNTATATSRTTEEQNALPGLSNLSMECTIVHA